MLDLEIKHRRLWSFDFQWSLKRTDMMNRTYQKLCSIRLVALAVIFTCLFCVSVSADDNAEREFTLKVLPVLKDKCFGCHGSDVDDIKGDYNMLTRDLLLSGGETGDEAVIAGKPDEGTLIPAIAWEDMEMPPKEKDPRSPEGPSGSDS